jgi:hypothetical protein
VRVVRSTITEVLSKTTPAEGKSDAVEATAGADKDQKDR